MGGHILKRNHTSRGPTAAVFFQTAASPRHVGAEVPTVGLSLRLGVATYVRMAGARVVRRSTMRFDWAEQFWNWLARKLERRRRLWVVAPDFPTQFRLLAGWRFIEAHQPGRWRLHMGEPTVVLRGRAFGKPLQFLALENWLNVPPAELAAAFPPSPPGQPPWSAKARVWHEWCEAHCGVTERAFLGLRDYLRERDYGVMGRTIGQCSMHAFSHRFMPIAVWCHRRPEVTRLERKAYFGGYAECFRVGEIREPIYELDVNSNYPSIMATAPLPVQLAEVRGAMGVDEADEYCQHWGGVAQVIVQTHSRTYPLRVKGRMVRGTHGHWTYNEPDRAGQRYRCYNVVGRYRTWLCGPELAHALERGHVAAVEKAAWYVCLPAYEAFARHFHAERRRLSGPADRAWRLFCKGMLVALGGYLGRKAPTWATLDGVTPPRHWGRGHYEEEEEGGLFNARFVAGVYQIEVGEGRPYSALVAVPAFLTSHGRERMRLIRSAAGVDHVFYQHTDAVLVDGVGFERLLLGGYVHPSRLGAFKLVSESAGCTIRGINDLSLDARRVLPGVTAQGPAEPDGAYLAWRTESVWDGIEARGREVVLRRQVRYAPPSEYRRGVVGPDGVVRPLCVWHVPGSEPV